MHDVMAAYVESKRSGLNIVTRSVDDVLIGWVEKEKEGERRCGR